MYICIVRHSVNQCPHVRILWTALISFCYYTCTCIIIKSWSKILLLYRHFLLKKRNCEGGELRERARIASTHHHLAALPRTEHLYSYDSFWLETSPPLGHEHLLWWLLPLYQTRPTPRFFYKPCLCTCTCMRITYEPCNFGARPYRVTAAVWLVINGPENALEQSRYGSIIVSKG